MPTALPQRSLERFLCCAIADDEDWHRRELKQLWLAVGDQSAWEFASEHESEGTAAIALEKVLGSELPIRWRDARERVERRITLYMQSLDGVATRLAVHGVPLVALKNSGIARAIFTDLGGCFMGDVDVLVNPLDFRQAHESMVGLGFRLKSRSPLGEKTIEEIERTGGFEYECDLPDGEVLWFELQWRPVAGRWIRPDQEPSAAALLERSVPIGSSSVRLLSPNDNLLQVCLHTAKHSFIRAPGLRLHTDVDRIVRRCQIDWDAFVKEVDRLQVRTAVYFSLRIPTELLLTPIPPQVLELLHPPSWKVKALERSLQKAGFFHPHRKKWSRLGFIWFNLLLYDDFSGLWRALFPDPKWICSHYRIERRWILPLWYFVRLWELTFKRAVT